MYTKQIEQLVRLQEIDEQILLLERELESAPRELADKEAEFQGVLDKKGQLQEKLDMLEAQKKRISGEIEDDTLKIKKSKNKLMMASNTREYHAMMREMDHMEKTNRMREDESMALAEELGRVEGEMGGIDSEVQAAQDALDQAKAGLDERVAKAQGDLDKLKESRATSGKAVPPPILSRYEFIRSRLRHPVIVPVETGVCGGCNISIPPQTFNELQRGKQIHSCPNCQRLIFWCEHLPGSSRRAAEGEES